MLDHNINKELYNYVISEAKEMALTGVKTAMVPTSLLYVDSTYQRSIKPSRWKKIKDMAENWSPIKCGAVIAVARPNEFRFAVVDGQGRKLAAEMAGVEKVFCFIAENLTKAQEASLFVNQNKNCVPLTPFEKFTAYLVAGDENDPAAKAARYLKKLCAEYHVEIKASAAPKAIAVLRCLSSAWQIAETNPEQLRWIFEVIKHCGWSTAENAYSEANCLALRAFYTRHADRLYEASNALVSGILAMKISPKRFESVARFRFADRGVSVAVSSLMEMLVEGEGRHLLE